MGWGRTLLWAFNFKCTLLRMCLWMETIVLVPLLSSSIMNLLVMANCFLSCCCWLFVLVGGIWWWLSRFHSVATFLFLSFMRLQRFSYFPRPGFHSRPGMWSGARRCRCHYNSPTAAAVKDYSCKWSGEREIECMGEEERKVKIDLVTSFRKSDCNGNNGNDDGDYHK